MTDQVRKTALFVLNRLDKEHTVLDRELDNILEKHRFFSKRDRSLLYSLVYGVLRWRKRIDWIIACFSNTPMEKIDPRVLNVLRLGTYQILFLDKIPVSAAVNTSVELSKTISHSRIAGYVNGVLRQIIRKQGDIAFPDKMHDPVSALSVIYAFPKWLIQRWISRFGADKTEWLCQGINTIPPITVRTNSLKTTRSELAASLFDLVDNIHISSHSPDGISFDLPKMSLPEMAPFKKGWFQVQDDGAQLSTILLDPRPGESILDACAGLGGKTGHIAQLMHNTGRLIAMDNSNHRLLRLMPEMKRLGVSIVKPFPHDLNTPLNIVEEERFDRILVDAPCSGLGVLRRNPDIKWHPQPEMRQKYQHRQITFLNHLAPLVKPSGILNYTVCSIEPEETTEVVSIFLKNHPQFSVLHTFSAPHSDLQQMIQQYGYMKTYPDFRNMDGFFSINFRRLE